VSEKKNETAPMPQTFISKDKVVTVNRCGPIETYTDIDKLAFSGAPAPANLSADEKLAYERLSFVYAKGIAYGFQMGLRPQTLYGIADSPDGLAAIFSTTTRAATR